MLNRITTVFTATLLIAIGMGQLPAAGAQTSPPTTPTTTAKTPAPTKPAAAAKGLRGQAECGKAGSNQGGSCDDAVSTQQHAVSSTSPQQHRSRREGCRCWGQSKTGKDTAARAVAHADLRPGSYAGTRFHQRARSHSRANSESTHSRCPFHWPCSHSYAGIFDHSCHDVE